MLISLYGNIMRDPKRIPQILNRIEKIWEQNPDLRFGQLIMNAINPDYLYEIEDEILISILEKLYDI